MLARAFRNLRPDANTPKPSDVPAIGAEGSEASPTSNPGIRAVNAERFAGGRGSANQPIRAEKRSAGRIRCADLRCAQGTLLDVSATGCRMSVGKKSTFTPGAPIRLDVSCADAALSVSGTVAWVRVMSDCTFHIGVAFETLSPAVRRELLDLVRTGGSSDGLSRGWAPIH